jgi:hypothetical protein
MTCCDENKTDCRQGRDCPNRAPIDLESIASATRFLEWLIVALLLIVAAGFVAAALRGAL